MGKKLTMLNSPLPCALKQGSLFLKLKGKEGFCSWLPAFQLMKTSTF